MKLIEFQSFEFSVQLLNAQISQLAILVCMVWLAVHCFARKRPFIAHALWCIVLIKAVFPPVLASPLSMFAGWGLPESQTKAFTFESPTQTAGPRFLPPTQRINAGSRGFSFRDFSEERGGVLAREDNENSHKIWERNAPAEDNLLNDTMRANSVVSVIDSELTEESEFGFYKLLIATWLITASIILTLCIARLWGFLRKVQSMTLKTPCEVVQTAETLKRKLKLRKLPQIVVVSASIGPAIVGFLRPKVLLPISIVNSVNRSQLEHLLAHELIHFKRGDLRWSTLQLLSSCLWWFHPFIWFAQKQLSLETERRCDLETIARLGCSPRDYAASLLEILERKQSLTAAPLVPGVRPMDITSNRMKRIMNLKHAKDRCPRWMPGFVLLLGCLIAVPGAAWNQTQEEKQTDTVQTDASKSINENNQVDSPADTKPSDDSKRKWTDSKAHGLANLRLPDHLLRDFPVSLLLEQIRNERKLNSEQAAAYIEMLVDDYFAEVEKVSPALIIRELQTVKLPKQKNYAADAIQLTNRPGRNRKVVGERLFVFTTSSLLARLHQKLFKYEPFRFADVEVQLEVLECDPWKHDELFESGIRTNGPYAFTTVHDDTWQQFKDDESKDSWRATKSRVVNRSANTEINLAPYWEDSLKIGVSSVSAEQVWLELNFSNITFGATCMYDQWLCIAGKPNQQGAVKSVIAIRPIDFTKKVKALRPDRWVTVSEKLSPGEVSILTHEILRAGLVEQHRNGVPENLLVHPGLSTDDIKSVNGMIQVRAGTDLVEGHSLNVKWARRAYSLLAWRKLANSLPEARPAEPSALMIDGGQLTNLSLDPPEPLRRVLDRLRIESKCHFGDRFIVVQNRWGEFVGDLIEYTPIREKKQLDPIDYVALRNGNWIVALRADQAITSEEQLRSVIADAWPVTDGLKVERISASEELAKLFSEASKQTASSRVLQSQKMPSKFLEITLQDCIKIALQNAKFLRVIPSSKINANGEEVELHIPQPLFRGQVKVLDDFPEALKQPIVVARLNEDMSLAQLEEEVTILIRAVENAYWDLYTSYRTYEATQTAFEETTELWRITEAETRASQLPPEVEAQVRALYAQFKSSVHAALHGSPVSGNDRLGLFGRERVLRQTMGLAPTDGALIRPKSTPVLSQSGFSWKDMKERTLLNNFELRQQKWAVKQTELELEASSRLVAGVPKLEFTSRPVGMRRALSQMQSSKTQLQKQQAELREKEVFVTQRLSDAFRNVESAFQKLTDYREQMTANYDEINVYKDKISADRNELSSLLDNLLRAQEREVRARILYYQTIAEYNKAISEMHYVAGDYLQRKVSAE